MHARWELVSSSSEHFVLDDENIKNILCFSFEIIIFSRREEHIFIQSMLWFKSSSKSLAARENKNYYYEYQAFFLKVVPFSKCYTVTLIFLHWIFNDFMNEKIIKSFLVTTSSRQNNRIKLISSVSKIFIEAQLFGKLHPYYFSKKCPSIFFAFFAQKYFFSF